MIMKTNIYSIYVTNTRLEYKYFINNIIKHLPATNLKLIHLHVHPMSELGKSPFHVTVYPEQKMYKVLNLNSIVKIFKTLQPSDRNVFVYSGHSDGINMKRLFRIDDFCKIIEKTIDKKADLVIFDSCLMGNIHCLYMCRHVTKYVIASPYYYDYLSVLETKSIWKPKVVGRNLIDEYMAINCLKSKFQSHLVMYNMNLHLDKYITFLLKNPKSYKSVIPKYPYYRDISNTSFITYQRSCKKRKSNLLIILKKPIRNYLPSKSDIFMQTYTLSS